MGELHHADEFAVDVVVASKNLADLDDLAVIVEDDVLGLSDGVVVGVDIVLAPVRIDDDGNVLVGTEQAFDHPAFEQPLRPPEGSHQDALLAPSSAAGRGFPAGAASIESRRPKPSVLICY